MHVSPEQRADSPSSTGSPLYIWLIFVVVGGMILHNGLDLVRKVRRKIAIQKGTIPEEPVPHRLAPAHDRE